MFSYQKNFVNPTLPVDEAQFYALVRATKWNEAIDKYRETGDASLKASCLRSSSRLRSMRQPRRVERRVLGASNRPQGSQDWW